MMQRKEKHKFKFIFPFPFPFPDSHSFPCGRGAPCGYPVPAFGIRVRAGNKGSGQEQAVAPTIREQGEGYFARTQSSPSFNHANHGSRPGTLFSKLQTTNYRLPTTDSLLHSSPLNLPREITAGRIPTPALPPTSLHTAGHPDQVGG